MAKVNSSNGNETKSEFLPWVKFKYDIIFFHSSISVTFKIKISHFYDYSESEIRNFFMGHI